MKPLLKLIVVLVPVVLALSALPFFTTTTYFIHFLILFFVYATLATSWNIIGGYAGQINLGQAAFFGIGAYTLALLYRSGISPIIALPLGGIMATLFAFVMSPTFRLRGAYFAVGTLGLTETLRVIMINWQGSGGASGLRIPLPQDYNVTYYYYLVLFLLIVTLATTYIMVNSRVGLALIAIRENEDAATSIGIGSLRYKMLALATSGFFAGTVGAFYAYYILFIEPHSIFSINWTSVALFSVIIGGPGTIIGPIVGALIFLSLSEFFLGFAQISLLFTGTLLIFVIIFFPTGLLGAARILWNRLRHGRITASQKAVEVAS